MASSWLKLDAGNRAWRTLIQGVVALVLLPALDAALQVVQRQLLNEGGGFDWRRTATLATFAAMTAVTMSLAAYVHRLKIDPSPLPSAEPPRPATVTERQMPATEASVHQ